MRRMYHEEIPIRHSLAAMVRRIGGYRYTGLPAGVHVGMPSTTITVVISLDDGLVVSWPSGDRTPRPHDLVICGLQTGPAHIHHNGSQYGIQVELTPAGARRLIGRPIAELAGVAAELGDLLGRSAEALREALADAPDWASRYRLLETEMLGWIDRTDTRRLRPAPEVGRAWQLVVGSGGTLPIGRIAAEVGWSTRHLGQRFRAEYGLTPKTVARVARFGRSHDLLRKRATSIAEVASLCGYADQAHLTREWQQIARITPTRWWAEDDLAFIQDDVASAG